MTSLALIPELHRDRAQAALTEAFGAAPLSALTPVTGGASGALVYRFEASKRPYLLRLETARDFFRDPQRTFACMAAAAKAGIAPAIVHADPAAGAVVMDFIEARPITTHPGGPAGIARDLGELAAGLHALPAFPPLADYPLLINGMVSRLAGCGLFAPGLLDAHLEGFDRIRKAYRWDPAGLTSSHNDPNPRNILYDGGKLWLVDWELSFRNDPLTDIAIMADNFAQTPELEDILLTAALGREPNRTDRARLTLMRQMTRLFYGTIVLSLFAYAPPSEPQTDLSAPTPPEFIAAVTRGDLIPGQPNTTMIFGKMLMRGFLDGLSAPGFEEALAIAGDGA